MSLLFKLENFQNLNLAEFDIYGKSWQMIGSKPSLVELCRYCMYDETNAKKLIDTFENNSTEQEFREFNNKFRGKTSSDILRLYWADQKNNEHSTERISAYHSPRRRLVSMSQSVKLRPYQIECVEQLVENYDQRQSSLLLLPTGAGKTKTALHALRRITDNNPGPTNILWLVHSTPLCQQAAHAIEKTWIENRSNSKHKQIWLNILFGGSGFKLDKDLFDALPSITVSTPDAIETNKLNFEQLHDIFDIIVCDEAHHGVEEQERVSSLWPKAHRIGLTATPELNKNSRIFNKLYSSLCFPKNYAGGSAKTKSKLIEDGILSDYDIEKCHLDHEADVLGLEFDRNKKWTEQVSSILVAKRICEDMISQNCDRILLFVNEIRQARTIAGLLRDHSISSTVVYGKLPRDEQKSRMNGFALGHFQVLISVDLLREGVDVPLVDGIVIMRRGLTNEDPMFSQILGRGLRGVESNGTPYCKVIHVE